MGADIIEHGMSFTQEMVLSAESLSTVMSEEPTMAAGLSMESIPNGTDDPSKINFRKKAQDMFKDLLTSCHRFVTYRSTSL